MKSNTTGNKVNKQTFRNINQLEQTPTPGVTFSDCSYLPDRFDEEKIIWWGKWIRFW